MRVTFEGIETSEQLDRARALGVAAEGQGWLFGRPTAGRGPGGIFEIEAEQAVAWDCDRSYSAEPACSERMQRHEDRCVYFLNLAM